MSKFLISSDHWTSGAPRMLTILATVCALMGVPAVAAAATIHIVAFGDSATAGSLLPPKDAYPAQLERALRAKGHEVQVHNTGVPGDTTAGALLRFHRAITPLTNIAIVEFGINDLRSGVPIKTIEDNISKIIRTLHARRIHVMVVGILELDLSAVSKANGVRYAHVTFPPGQYRASDGEHFNAEGYAILTERIIPAIEEMITLVKAGADPRPVAD